MQFGKFWVPHFQTKPCKLTKILLCSAWWRGFCPWPGGLAPGTNSTGTSSSGREFCWGDGQLLNLQQTPVAWWLIRGYAIPYSWHYHHDGNRLLPYWWRKVAIPRTIAPRGSMVESMSPLGWSTAPSSPWRGKTFREAQLWHEFLLKYLFDGNARMDAVAQYRWMVLFYRDPTHTRMMVVMIGSPLVYQNWLPWAKAKAEEHCQHAEEGLGMLTFYQPWWKLAQNGHGIVAKQKIVWKDLEAEIELDEIEKRAPAAPCRLKHCDWPNVERTQSRHEKLAASVIGKTRQDSFMLQTCRVLATLYTDPFLWEWSQRSAQPWRPNLPRLWTWWSWWSLDWWDNWQEINGNQWLFIATLITKYWLIPMVFQWYSNGIPMT